LALLREARTLVYDINQHVQDKKKWKEKNATTRAIDSVAKCREGTAKACIRGQYGIAFIKNDHRRKKSLVDFGDF
jgi:hypothetical protein